VALLTEFAPASFKYCPAGSKLVFVPNASHWVQLDEPDIVNKEIAEFIK
jgi:pimeloyl-ACP methyl ester carboxylesterase